MKVFFLLFFSFFYFIYTHTLVYATGEIISHEQEMSSGGLSEDIFLPETPQNFSPTGAIDITTIDISS